MTLENRKVVPVSEMIKGIPKRSLRDPVLFILVGILIVVGGFWQLNRQIELARYLPEGENAILIQQTMEGAILGLFIGAVLLVGSIIMHKVNRKIGGVVGFIFSLFGFYVPGTGFYLGPLLGIIVGINSLMANKPLEAMDPDEIL